MPYKSRGQINQNKIYNNAKQIYCILLCVTRLIQLVFNLKNYYSISCKELTVSFLVLSDLIASKQA